MPQDRNDDEINGATPTLTPIPTQTIHPHEMHVPVSICTRYPLKSKVPNVVSHDNTMTNPNLNLHKYIILSFWCA